jgi:NAD(P)-dependent dehydrogenase (short-subunit alcohol dehydrogenase family)
MRVFVAGATGVIGRFLVPGLIAAGHEVTVGTRSSAKAGQLAAAGATPVVVDGLRKGRGASNEKAKRELGWIPRYPSWRDGFPLWAEDFKPGRAA